MSFTSASTSTPALPVSRSTLPVVTGTWALGALRVAGRSRRSANLHSIVDGSVTAGLGIEHGLGFGLGFFQFQFFAIFLGFGWSTFWRVHFAQLRQGRLMNLRHSLPRIAIQMSRAGLRLLFEFVVSLIGG